MDGSVALDEVRGKILRFAQDDAGAGRIGLLLGMTRVLDGWIYSDVWGEKNFGGEGRARTADLRVMNPSL